MSVATNHSTVSTPLRLSPASEDRPVRLIVLSNYVYDHLSNEKIFIIN